MGPVADLAVNLKTRRMAAATMGPGGAAIVWKTERPFGSAGQPIPHPSGVERLVFTPDGTKLATEAEDGIGRIWTLPILDGRSPSAATLPGLTGPSPVLAMSGDSDLVSDGGYVATDFGAAIGQVWNISSREPAVSLRGPRERLFALELPPGRRVGSRVNQPRKPLAALVAERRPSRRLPRSGPGTDGGGRSSRWPHGRLRHGRRHSQALEYVSGALIAEPVADKGGSKAHGARVTSLAFSGNGRRLVSSGCDGKVYVWKLPEQDADSPEPLRTGLAAGWNRSPSSRTKTPMSPSPVSWTTRADRS